jgi:hypothetical protein
LQAGSRTQAAREFARAFAGAQGVLPQPERGEDEHHREQGFEHGRECAGARSAKQVCAGSAPHAPNSLQCRFGICGETLV